MPLRLVFMGTPEFAVPTLIGIVRAGHDVAAVYTRVAKPAGRRGMQLTSSPVEREARRIGLPLLTPSSLRSAEAESLCRGHRAELAVIVAYGLILPRPILEAFPLGCFNLHASLLPRWRGAAPINRAIMAGDRETGVMVMKMEEGLDTGPIGLAERVAIGDDATAGDLHDLLARRGADLMVQALSALQRGSIALTSQGHEGVTYAHKISKEETRIDWSRPADEVHNHVRGLSPHPGAWCELPGGSAGGRIKVIRTTRAGGSGAPGTVLDHQLTIACATGAVRIVQLQRAGRHVMAAEEFLRGATIAPGIRFG
ncbi:MAG: methionyl-tRNA formyltransferase [Xanthobacteraceae bacterium]